MLAQLKAYYKLTKPGIIRGNLLTAIAGFFLASKSTVNFALLCAVIIGVILVIACGCVLNNYIDRDIDKKMKRTKNRALVTGEIPFKSALIFAALLGILGFVDLLLFTNPITVFVGVIGLFFYVVAYSVWKRRSTLGTVVGSVSGATALVAGYVAVTNMFDVAAALLFLCMFIWQMPHFYAIAIYKVNEYTNAAIPVLPAVKGMRTTKIYIVLYITAYIASTSLLTIFGYTGYTYFAVMLALNMVWLFVALQGFKTDGEDKWAHKVFGYSLIILLVFSLLISLNVVLP